MALPVTESGSKLILEAPVIEPASVMPELLFSIPPATFNIPSATRFFNFKLSVIGFNKSAPGAKAPPS